MSTELTHLTTCIHCGQKFSSPRIEILGEPTARLEAYLKALSDHLKKRHPELGQVMVAHGAAFMEMLFLRNFKTTDPELSEQQDRVRWQVHQQTLKCRYPDEHLMQQACELGELLYQIVVANLDECGGIKEPDELKADLASNIEEAFTSIRDALEEPGKYPAVEKGAEAITR
jgi:hypothetical protein